MHWLSSYADGLSQEAKARYLDKIVVINGIDSLADGVLSKVLREHEDLDNIPPVDACDLVLYLVFQTTFITAKQFKAHKGLQAYNHFVCGWVKEISTHKMDENMLPLVE